MNLKLYLLIIICFIFSSINAQTFNNTTGGAITDNKAVVCYPLTVTGVGVINGTYGLSRVCIKISHLNVGDLEIWLKAPDGTEVPLSYRRGGAGDNYNNTCFTANAPTSIQTGTPPFNGTFRPLAPLGAVNNGQNANGEWFICIKDWQSPTAGTLDNFSLTFSNTPAPPAPPASVQDCQGAIPLCNNVYSESVSYTGAGTNPSEINSSISCLKSGERNSVWYTFTTQTAGQVSFVITPNVASEDYDWAVYNLTNARCHDIYSNPSLQVRCNWDGGGGPTGPTGIPGTRHTPTIPVQPNQTYVVIVSHYSQTSNGYTINFGASTAVIFDTSKPTIETIAPANACGTNKINVGFSENILCSSIQASSFAVTGPGGPYTVTGWSAQSCNSSATSYTSNIVLNVSPALDSAGTYQVCLTPASGSFADLCSNTIAASCSTFNILPKITPVFSPIAAFCQRTTPPVLPAVSNNGINGIWSPSVVNNDTSSVYTFVPNQGTCGINTPVPVTVIPAPSLGPDKTITKCPAQTVDLTTQYNTSGLPASWTINGSTVSNPSSVSAAGNYQLVVTNTDNCTDTAIVKLINSNTGSTSSIVYDTVCQGQLPYLWNGNSYSQAGTYKDTIPNAAGCDSLMTLNLVLDTIITVTTNASICENQTPYTWNGSLYTIPGTYRDTLSNGGGCDSIIILNLVINSKSTSQQNVTICQRQLPYVWNGNSYNASGNYNDTIANPAGCDSIMSLQLTVTPTVSGTDSMTICQSQLPYTWNGTVYNTAGTFNDTLQSASGCDSIATLNLTIKANSTSQENLTVCSNQMPYSWNGNSYNAAGTYIDTITNSIGCDSIMTLNLTVNNVLRGSDSASICQNQLPYLWNGNSYNAAGTYTDSLMSASGCDSIATLNLVVKQSSTSQTNVRRCSSQLPFVWNGNNYSASGTYSDTIPNAAGCDSIMVLQLSVDTVSTSTTNVAICQRQLPYSWNGNIITSGGMYSDTLTGSTGCDSILILNLTVKANSNTQDNIIICSNQLPYFWNGNNYNAAGTYKDTLPNAAGCDSIITLNLAIINVLTSTTTESICQKQLPFNWNGNFYNSAGTYKDTLVSTGGCDSIATLQLVVKQNSASQVFVTQCSNQPPYLWNGKSYSTTGTYRDTIPNAAGCDSIMTLNFTINSSGSSLSNVSICQKQLPYVWHGKSYNISGTYSDTIVTNANCDSIVTLNLTVNTATSSQLTVDVCSNQLPYVLNGNSYTTPGTYIDTITNSAGCDSVITLILSVKNSSTSQNTLALCSAQFPYLWNGTNLPSPGTYTYTTTNTANCDSVATLVITLKPNPSAPILTNNSPICVGERLELEASSIAGASYKWSGPNAYSSSDQNPNINTLSTSEAGLYAAYVVVDGCASTASTTTVILEQTPIVNAGPDRVIFEGDSVMLNATVQGNNLRYKWTPSLYFVSADTIKNPIVRGIKTITYYLNATSANQCTSEPDGVVVTVLPKQRQFNIPNAISPNGDGINDKWILKELEGYPDATVEIFNRYGAVVYRTIERYTPWDATMNGKPLPEGVYYFIIRVDKDKQPIAGTLTVIR